MRSKLAVSLVGVLAGIGAMIVSATPASAVSNCNSTATRAYSSGTHETLPVYRTSSGYTTSCILGVGNSGSAVSALQRGLKYCNGHGSLDIDGIYGSDTKAAVRSVQAAHGLDQDGVYGPHTRDAMKWQILNNSGGSWTGRCGSPA